MPQLGSCASSGRAWRLWAARHFQGAAGPLGAQPLLLGLERAAPKAADLTALDHTGISWVSFVTYPSYTVVWSLLYGAAEVCW